MSDVSVTVVDINPARITAWKSMNLPIYEPGLDELVYAARDGVELQLILPLGTALLVLVRWKGRGGIHDSRAFSFPLTLMERSQKQILSSYVSTHQPS